MVLADRADPLAALRPVACPSSRRARRAGPGARRPAGSRFAVGRPTRCRGAEFVFLCVPTPQSDDGSADLSYVEAVAKEIAPHLEPGSVIVNKSTVPVGSATGGRAGTRPPDISVVSNPEFLREGTAVPDSLHPERIVVGADDPAAAARVGELFSATQAPLLITDAATAETIKYASNAFLATKLSFVNAVAGLCEAVGADVRDVILGLGYDKRIGFEFLRPARAGAGAACPRTPGRSSTSPSRPATTSPSCGAPSPPTTSSSPGWSTRSRRPVGGSVDGATVGRVGSHLQGRHRRPARIRRPSRSSRRLAAVGATVQAFDPTVEAQPGWPSCARRPAWGLHLRRGLPTTPTPPARARAVVVLTEWDEFRWLDFTRVRSLMAAPSVVDARNLLDPAAVRRFGFEYTGIGRR